MHRLCWHQRVQEHPAAAKFMSLDLHHVVFRSLGGGDQVENLVPLCPLCHRVIHEGGGLGRSSSDEDSLRALWALWVRLGQSIPAEQTLGRGEPTVTVRVALDVYGLTAAFVVGAELTYADARREILERTVGVLGREDPHFPFVRGQVGPLSWSVSSDPLLGDGSRRDEVLATGIFARCSLPLTLQAPVIVTLTRRPNPLLAGTERQRTL